MSSKVWQRRVLYSSAALLLFVVFGLSWKLIARRREAPAAPPAPRALLISRPPGGPAPRPARPSSSDLVSQPPAAAAVATPALGAPAPAADSPDRVEPLPPVRHLPGVAPAVVPAEIINEHDPLRRARLLAAHRVKVARGRLAMFRHRRRLLARTISGRRTAGGATAEIVDLERQQLLIAQAIRDTSEELQRALEALHPADLEHKKK